MEVEKKSRGPAGTGTATVSKTPRERFKTMKFYGKAEEAANVIVKAFQNPNDLPKALASIFVSKNDDSIPCHHWSWSNQLITALLGHADARGYRQWQKVGRHVKQGEKSFPILVPLKKKIEREDAKTGESESAYYIYGFKSAPVFGYSQTDGESLDDPNPELTEWIQSLPLIDVAEQWGISIQTFNGEGSRFQGMYRSDGSIALGVKNLATWCHEMIHAADHRNVGQLKGGQHLDQEIVAEFGGAILLTILGSDVEADLGGCWEYLKAYAERENQEVVAVCQRFLKRTCEAVALILDTADSLDPVTA